MRIEIPGKPVPQARMRVFTRMGRGAVYDPCARDKFMIRAHIKAFIEEHFPKHQYFNQPKVHFEFFMPIPQSMRVSEKKTAIEYENKKHQTKPDVDNLIKLYLDCLLDLVIKDDNNVSLGWAYKIYSGNPRTVIYVTESADHIQKGVYDDMGVPFITDNLI